MGSRERDQLWSQTGLTIRVLALPHTNGKSKPLNFPQFPYRQKGMGTLNLEICDDY